MPLYGYLARVLALFPPLKPVAKMPDAAHAARYAADRVVEKYQTATCDQLKQARAEGSHEKKKLDLKFVHDD